VLALASAVLVAVGAGAAGEAQGSERVPSLHVLWPTPVGGRAEALAGGGAVRRAGDYGVLERFAPQSATTWWAIVESNLKPKSLLVRTTDSGQHWQAATPPAKMISSSWFLGRDDAWIEAGTLSSSSRTEPLYRTLDGGRSWQRLANVANECQLDFVDERHGWCVAIGAAAGSESVALYRTSDGAATWSLVSRTGLYDKGSTPGALPYGCDKTITFTSPTVGWAPSFCNGGSPYLYTSRDGGARWHALAPVPIPKGLRTPPAGEGLSLPVVSGSRLVLSVDIGGSPRGATAIATSANGGRSWRTRLVPGPRRYWTVDLIDVLHWRLSDGSRLLATDDGGRHWRRSKPTVKMKDMVGTPLRLDFLTPHLGFAIPDGNGGPLWSTRDGGTTWKPVTITAGPFTVPRRP
jgi:photosystem II stability/assembly factor-like uncharacterized protein